MLKMSPPSRIPTPTLSSVRTAPPLRSQAPCASSLSSHLTFCHSHSQNLNFVLILTLFSSYLTGHILNTAIFSDFVWHPSLIPCLSELLPHRMVILLRNTSEKNLISSPATASENMFSFLSSLSLSINSMFLLNYFP